MIEFLTKYGFFILEVCLSVSCLFIYIFKKNKIVLKDTAFEKLMVKLPSIISKAELLNKCGSDKKSFVLGVSFALLADLTGKTTEEISNEYGLRISEAIESILETPQKKEVNL